MKTVVFGEVTSWLITIIRHKHCGGSEYRLSGFSHHGEEAMMLVGVPEDHLCRFKEHDAVYIKYEEGKRKEAEAAVRRVLSRFDVPERENHVVVLDEYISENYEEETYYANLLSALTVIQRTDNVLRCVLHAALLLGVCVRAEHGHPPG